MRQWLRKYRNKVGMVREGTQKPDFSVPSWFSEMKM